MILNRSEYLTGQVKVSLSLSFVRKEGVFRLDTNRSCSLCLHACQVRVTVGDSGVCCRVCVKCFER